MDRITVRVAVKIRPWLSSELENGSQSYAIVVPRKQKIQVADAEKPYRFDHVSGPDDNNEKFYSSAIRNAVTEIFNERDVTIITYGDRGSGKTWTMGTNYRPGDKDMGVIPRAIDDIFMILDSDSDNEYRVTVTFVELYNKEMFDLLSTSKERNERVVEITNDQPKVRCLTERQVSSAEDVLQCLIQGSQERINSEKKANSQSSRSHAIFTISVNQLINGNPRNVKKSKLHFVDLAGTRRVKKVTKKDNENINKNLLAVGRIITNLKKGKSDLSMKYHDNKLAIYLRESLQNNSIALLIGCIGPADCDRIETLDTLRYGSRLRKMKSEIIESEPEKKSNETDAEIYDEFNLISSELNLGFALQISASDGSHLSTESCKTDPENIENTLDVLLPLAEDSEEMDSDSEPSLTEQIEMQTEDIDCNKKLTDKTNEIDTNPINTKNVQRSTEFLEPNPKHTNSMIVMILKQFQEALPYRNENLEAQEFMLRVYRKIQDLLNEQNKFTKNILNHVVVENDTMDQQNLELAKLQIERYYEGQALEPYIALLEELVSSFIKELAPLEILVRDLEETKYRISVLEAEKINILQVFTYTESYSENWTLARVAMKKIADIDVHVWKLWAIRMKLAMDIERREKFDQQIVNMSAQIEMLKRARDNFVGIINEDSKYEINFHADVENRKEIQKSGETIKKKSKKRSNSTGRHTQCACKVSGCVSQLCSCHKNGFSCVNCKCISELCRNSDKENNSSNVSEASILNNSSSAKILKCGCKLDCSTRNCACRKNSGFCNVNCKCDASNCTNKIKKKNTETGSSIAKQAPKRSADGNVAQQNRCAIPLRDIEAGHTLFLDPEQENDKNKDPRKRSRLQL